jgi:DNA-binding response OmpR family regulator
MPPLPRILIVEDHDDLAEALQVNLKRDGYETAVASDGRQALAIVPTWQPDVIVLDLGLRGMDGFTALERLRSDGHWCPVLILSARDADTDKLEGFRLGADDYVTKPFRTLELLARIGALVRRSQRERGIDPNNIDLYARPQDPVPGTVTFTDEELVARFNFTPRQAQVAKLLAQGLSNPDIADALAISRFTARNHAEAVLAKLQVPNRGRVAAVLLATLQRDRTPPTG